MIYVIPELTLSDQHPQNNQWLVIGGCPRSGTTMLNFILNSHPDIFLANEQNLYRTAQAFSKQFMREDKMHDPVLQQSLNRKHWVKEREAAVLRREKSLLPTLTTLLKSSLCPDLNSANLILGDKCPNYYLWDIKWMKRLLPGLRFIHISRNPVDVMASYLMRRDMTLQNKDRWLIASLEHYLAEWMENWNFICSRTSDPDFFHLDYQAFVTKPDENLARLSSWLQCSNSFDTSQVNPNHSQSSPASKLALANKLRRYLPPELIDWQLPLDELVQTIGNLDINRIPKWPLGRFYAKWLRHKHRFRNRSL